MKRYGGYLYPDHKKLKDHLPDSPGHGTASSFQDKLLHHIFNQMKDDKYLRQHNIEKIGRKSF